MAVLAALSRNLSGAPPGGPQGAPGGASKEGLPQAAIAGEASTTEATEGALDSSESEDGEEIREGGPPGEGGSQGPPKELMEALDDWRIYTGARLLPLQLSPQSVSLLQRLQQSIIRGPQPKRRPSVSLQQQQRQEGGLVRPQGSLGASGEMYGGPPNKSEAPIRHGYLEKLGGLLGAPSPLFSAAVCFGGPLVLCLDRGVLSPASLPWCCNLFLPLLLAAAAVYGIASCCCCCCCCCLWSCR